MAPTDSEDQGAIAEETSAALIERIAQGDQQALRALYDRYAGLVNGLALRVLHDPADAEDVVQTVFIQVWRQADRFDARRGAPEAWIHVLARTRALDHLRRRTQRREEQEEEDGPDSAASPSSIVHQLSVREALARLPERERRALELAYYEGLTQMEIAERLQTPVGTIKTRIRSAMIRLRRDLGRQPGLPGEPAAAEG